VNENGRLPEKQYAQRAAWPQATYGTEYIVNYIERNKTIQTIGKKNTIKFSTTQTRVSFITRRKVIQGSMRSLTVAGHYVRPNPPLFTTWLKQA